MIQEFGLYVHVPFCVRRCPYCAFYSCEGASASLMASYPRWILAELALRGGEWREFALKSIYIGGGTPSLLLAAAVGEMLKAIREEFALTQTVEITLEANPGTITAQSLAEYLKAGVNRLSLGVQALDEKRLSFLGRIHSRAEAFDALRLAQQAGFTSWSADLMFGTPLESQESWKREFDELLPLQPGGISFYSLTVEEGSLLEGRQSAGEKVSLDPDQTVELMLYAAERLQEAGYRHYEVSNWAQPGAECRHNIHYWGRGWYLGLGPSAHSFRDSRRSWNLPDLDAYTKALKAHQLPPSDSESLSHDQVRSEWVYLNLRQAGGLDLTEYGELFGEAPIYWNAMLQSISQKGLGIFNGGRFAPNNRGLLLADEIAVRLLG